MTIMRTQNPSNPELVKAISKCLLKAKSSSDGLAQIHEQIKKRDKRVSLGFLCKAIGLASTGYLSDVMKGRRVLNSKYRIAMARALKLNAVQSEFLSLLYAEDEGSRESLGLEHNERRGNLEKLLQYDFRPFPPKLQTMFFAFEVFAAFGLFSHEASRDELRQLFGGHRGVEIDQALRVLLAAELVAPVDSERKNVYRVISENVNFLGSTDGISHLDFIRASIKDADAGMATWFGQNDRAFFSSSILSITMADFLSALPQIKEKIRGCEAEIESAKANTLLRFNVQVYPLLSKPVKA